MDLVSIGILFFGGLLGQKLGLDNINFYLNLVVTMRLFQRHPWLQ